VTAGRSASYRTPKPKRFFVRESPRGLSLDDLFEKDLFESRPDEEAICRARRKGLLAAFGKSYRLVDLFSGAGGMTLGFSAEFGHSLGVIKRSGITGKQHSAVAYGLPQ
jgi:hypothetical protein